MFLDIGIFKLLVSASSVTDEMNFNSFMDIRKMHARREAQF